MNDKKFFDEETVENVREYEKSERALNEEKKKFEQIHKQEIMAAAAKSNIKNEDLLKAYIGKNYDRITGKGFNWSAFFFGSQYMIYRKMYLYGFLVMVFQELLTLYFSTLSSYGYVGPLVMIGFNLLVVIILAATFNARYLNKSVSKINELKERYKNDELLEKCRKVGGTSLLAAIILTSILSGIAAFVAIILGVFAP